MNQIIIRQASPNDLDHILQIENLSFTVPWTRDSFLSAFSSEYMTLFAAEKNGAVVGFGCLALLPPESEIPNIAVHPEERGQGIGEMIFKTMLDHAAKKGADTAFLEVRESNSPARALYEKNGFVSIGIRRDYYTKPTENAVIMQKTPLTVNNTI